MSDKEIVFIVCPESLHMLYMMETLGFPKASHVNADCETGICALIYKDTDRAALVECFSKAEDTAFIQRCDEEFNGGKPSNVKQWFNSIKWSLIEGRCHIGSIVQKDWDSLDEWKKQRLVNTRVA